jgi:hypothetical protein
MKFVFAIFIIYGRSWEPQYAIPDLTKQECLQMQAQHKTEKPSNREYLCIPQMNNK